MFTVRHGNTEEKAYACNLKKTNHNYVMTEFPGTRAKPRFAAHF